MKIFFLLTYVNHSATRKESLFAKWKPKQIQKTKTEWLAYASRLFLK